MLDIRVDNSKVIAWFDTFRKQDFPDAITRALTRAAEGIYEIAFQWLSGAGGAGKNNREDYFGFSRGQMKNGVYHSDTVNFRSYHTAGAYPVPVRTGNLRRLLNWLGPGESKRGDGGSIIADKDEAIVFDSAVYAPAVFLGTGSSAKFGPRNALLDGLELFNRGDRITWLMSEEIQKEINKQ